MAYHAGAERASAAAGLTACVLVFGSLAVLRGLQVSAYPHGRLGACNVVTLVRGAAIAAIAGLLAVPDILGALGYPLAVLAAIILALDGVDGWAARRAGLSSSFGARLDVETDVVFALVLAALAVAMGKVGVWFLVLGFMRPAFMLAGRIWPWVHAPLPPSQRRRVVAGVQMGGQVVLLLPVLAAPLSDWVGAIILAVVVSSFARDILALHARVREVA
jgi:phosphatidylglycerophosphate synthase